MRVGAALGVVVAAFLLAAAPASGITAKRLGVVPVADAIGDAGRGQVWVRVRTREKTGELNRFDPRKRRYVRSCRIPQGSGPLAAAGGGRVWFTGRDGLFRADRRCRLVSHKFGGRSPSIHQVAGGPDGSAWVLVKTRDQNEFGFVATVHRVGPSGASRAVVTTADQPPNLSDQFDDIESIAVGSDGALWISATDDDSPPAAEDDFRTFNVLARVGEDGRVTVEERSDGLRVLRLGLLPGPGRRFFVTERVQDGPDIDLSPRHTQVARFRPGRGFDAAYGRGTGQGQLIVDRAGRPWIADYVRRTRGSKARGFALVRLDGGRRRTRVLPREKRTLGGPILTTVVGGRATFAVPSASGRYAMALYRVR